MTLKIEADVKNVKFVREKKSCIYSFITVTLANNMSYQVLRDPDSGEPVLFLGQKRLTYSEVRHQMMRSTLILFI
jgi:hypothetical protein